MASRYLFRVSFKLRNSPVCLYLLPALPLSPLDPVWGWQSPWMRRVRVVDHSFEFCNKPQLWFGFCSNQRRYFNTLIGSNKRKFPTHFHWSYPYSSILPTLVEALMNTKRPRSWEELNCLLCRAEHFHFVVVCRSNAKARVTRAEQAHCSI